MTDYEMKPKSIEIYYKFNTYQQGLRKTLQTIFLLG